MNQVRWGIIGCGDVTEVKSGPAFQKVPGSALVAVMRRDGAKAADYARRHGVPRWYDDAEKLIADPEVNAVYVATPPDMHEAYALRVAAAGKPCYVEKPMARNASEAQRMVAAFEAAGVPLFVAYYRRGMARFLQVKGLLDRGELGAVRLMDYRFEAGAMLNPGTELPWRMDPAIAGGGLFLDLGSHALDLMDFFFGPLRNAMGTARGKCVVEDEVALSFDTDFGVKGTAHWSFVASEKRDAFTITGESGTLTFSCFGHEPLLLTRPSGESRAYPNATPEHVQQGLIRQIVEKLRGEGALCSGSAVAAVRTQEVMDAAVSGFYGGREDGFWNRRR